MTRALLALPALGMAAAAVAALAATPVKVEKTWTGHMPLAVPPLVQSSVGTTEAWQGVWATCQMQGAAPAVDFDRKLVLVAVRRSSVVRFNDVTLDNGNLATKVIATPDVPNRMTCALALVSREGVRTVNGAPPGK
ncbi:MAG: hypothetical protein U1F54_15770 [Burkholderiales bacterium]